MLTFGKRVIADVIKLKMLTRGHPGLPEWTLNPKAKVLMRVRQRDEIDRGETMGRRRKGALSGQSDGGKTLTLP